MPESITLPPPAAPVVVTPILPSQSRTLRLAWLTTLWTAIVGFLPDVVEILLHLLVSDPKFSEAVEAWLPRSIRYVAMAALIGAAQRHRQLRNDTSTPIIGTPAAENLPTLNEAKKEIV